MPISKETIERIRKDAFDAYSDVFDSSADDLERGYVHGAEAEAERAQGLIDAMQEALRLIHYNHRARKTLDTALANYNSKPVK